MSKEWAAAPAARGTILSSEAGLTVSVPTSSSGSSSSLSDNYGAGLIGNFTITVTIPTYVMAVVSRRDPPPRLLVSGSMTFYDGETALATVPLDADGNATFVSDSWAFALGGHQIRAVYSGDAGHRADESDAAAVRIHKTPTELLLDVPAQVTLQPRQLLSLKATVRTLVPDLAAPDGIVAFFANGKRIGTVRLNSLGDPGIDANLPRGTYKITAVYRGSDTMKRSVSASATMKLMVQKVPTSM